jgi:hypothetical protein
VSQPSVCAILLTADRPELTRKAVECFRAQDYPNKRLLVYDTGQELEPNVEAESEGIFWVPGSTDSCIGRIRNRAIELWNDFDIVVTFDSDDYSHPSRISEQVNLLQSSGADVVGYSDLLFWREPRKLALSEIPASALNDGCSDGEEPGEAWLYTSAGPKPSPPGTTLCYTREFWSRNPFPATSQGEELQFLSRAKVETVSSFPAVAPRGTMTTMEPRMIARIHPGAAGNTSTAYEPKKMLAESKRRNPAWRRTPEWDQYCQSVMARSAA